MTDKNILRKMFGVNKPIIGNIHCLPFPGSPPFARGGMKQAIDQAVEEAHIMADAGIDGVIIENAGDIPYPRPENIGAESVAALTVIVQEISREVDLPIGVICLANGVLPSIAISAATRSSFIRANIWAHAYVGVEGLMNGSAAEALRYRSQLQASDVKVFADVHVKFGAHALTADRPILELARDVEFAGADVLVATGTRTGMPTGVDEVLNIRKGTSLEVIVGSGLNPENAGALLEVADGAIVGSWLKYDGYWANKVSPSRTKRLMDKVISLR